MKLKEFTVKSINPKEISTKELHNYLLSAVAPRPIAFVSTIAENRNVNVSPFSFFNIIGINPPMVGFSVLNRFANNEKKNTLENVEEVGECVINIVTEEIMHQVSLASAEYEKGVNEFHKVGLTPIESDIVKPPRCLESKVSLECKVQDIVQIGDGNLVICEVVRIHIHEDVLYDEGGISTEKMKLVARMGENWYCRAFGDVLFEIPRPSKSLPSLDKLPKEILHSEVLTGNDLVQLSNIEGILEEKRKYTTDVYKHAEAKQLLSQGNLAEAWKMLLID